MRMGIDDSGDHRLITEIMYRGGEIVFVHLIRANAEDIPIAYP
jgi:hypothetical protein